MTPAEIRAGLSDLHLLACTIYGEAAGEPIEGQVAVGCVIRNRAKRPGWWGKSLRTVCLAPHQFSCWHEGDTANTERLYELAEAFVTGQPPDDATVRQVLWIADGLMSSAILDRVKRADHYLTVALYDSMDAPGWSRKTAPVCRVAHHVFFRLEG
jgi:hypothetical protein